MSTFDVDKSEYMAQFLRRHGMPVNWRSGWYAVSCPNKNAHTHGDKNKSASVHMGAGVLNCHGCGVRGDAFDWMKEIENVDAKEVRDIFGGTYNKPQPAGDTFTFDR